MDYELAKQLKETGFPQELKLGTGIVYDNGKVTDFVCQGNGDECDCTTPNYAGYGIGEWVRFPTLSELIEACGDNFIELDNLAGIPDENKVWKAIGERYLLEEVERHFGEGKTPEEAVAKLWISLKLDRSV